MLVCQLIIHNGIGSKIPDADAGRDWLGTVPG
jgi:hypothetical protein